MTSVRESYRRQYPNARELGLASWNPDGRSRGLLERVEQVLEEYEAHLPLTVRQVFYRLVGVHGYEKTENAYQRLVTMLTRARRAGLLDWAYVRDDGIREEVPGGFTDPDDFWQAVRYSAKHYRLDRSMGQPVAVEIWVEAVGMMPQVTRVAGDYGARVVSSGGFSSVTAIRDAAGRIAERDRPTMILNVGDHDPSGKSIFERQRADVFCMVDDLGGRLPEFRRVAITPMQAEWYALPGSPAKSTDQRGTWEGEAYQAEALPPDVLASELREALSAHVDGDILQAVIEREAEQRSRLLEEIGGARDE